MSYLPFRLLPGADLRRALEQHASTVPSSSAFLLAGIGSLSSVSIRFAGTGQETHMRGPFEIVSLSGTLAHDGAHLHMSIADADGRVFGGHVGYGNIVRTTAEVLLVVLEGWSLSRAPDPSTGYRELQVKRLGPGESAT